MSNIFTNSIDKCKDQGPTRMGAMLFGTVVLIVGVWYAILQIPTPAPDMWDDDLDDVAGFFFDKDFNRLPARERMKMLQEFVARFRDGGQEESAMLAMFMADVTYEMRKQVENNVVKLGVDMWSEWGNEYASVAEEDRERYLHGLIVELDKLGDGFNSRESEKSDNERVDGARRQAKRDQERSQEWSDGKPPDADQVNGMLGLFSNDIASRSSAQDRASIMKLTRDLSRYARGESLDGGGG